MKLALSHPIDVIEGLAVAECLAGLGTEGHAALRVLAQRHPAHAVRETAMKILSHAAADTSPEK